MYNSKKSRRGIFILTLIIAASLITGDLYARRKGDHKGPGHHKKMFFGDPQRMKKKLDLTDEQINKIDKINKKYEVKFLKLREKLEPEKIKLKRFLIVENVDLNKVHSQLKKIAEYKVEIRFLRIKQRIEIEKVLTPSQRIKLRSERKNRHKGKGHGRKGPGRCD